MSPSTSMSSPASPSMSSCRCPMAFPPASHSRRPNGKFARAAGPFLLHPNELKRKPFCVWGNRIRGAPSSILSGLLIWPMWRRREITLPSPSSSPTLLHWEHSSELCFVPALVDLSPARDHAPDRPRRELFLDPLQFTLSPAPSSVAPADAAKWPEDQRRALVTHEPQRV